MTTAVDETVESVLMVKRGDKDFRQDVFDWIVNTGLDPRSVVAYHYVHYHRDKGTICVECFELDDDGSRVLEPCETGEHMKPKIVVRSILAGPPPTDSIVLLRDNDDLP